MSGKASIHLLTSLMPVNFTLCGDKFMGRGIFANSTVSYANYASNGTVRGMFESLDGSERPPLITLEGCRALCGITPEYYDWSQASATILTWILPVIGLLLQAPFESNAFWKTLFALARWTGSPIASLSYVLWNIKVNGKCSLMVDMCELPSLGVYQWITQTFANSLQPRLTKSYRMSTRSLSKFEIRSIYSAS